MAIPFTSPATAAQSDPGLFDKWRTWLSNPQNRTGLLQTGLALMQPRALGQSQFGHIAGSVGQGLAAMGRGQAREEAQARLDEKEARELQEAELERRIKLAGLDLDRMNTQSLISDRIAGRGLDRARFGLEQQQESRLSKYTEAQIANLDSLSDTREGNLALKTQAEAARAQAIKDKQGLEELKFGLQQQRLRLDQAGGEQKRNLIGAQIKQIESNIAKANAEIANLDSQIKTRAGNLTLRTQSEAARQQALRNREGLERQKFQLQQEIAAASQGMDAKEAAKIDAQIKQIENNIAAQDAKVKQSTDVLAKINVQNMFRTKAEMRKAIREGKANQVYTGETKSIQELAQEEEEIAAEVERRFGGGGSETPTSQSQPPTAQKKEKFMIDDKGNVIVLRNGKWVPYP